MKWNNPGFLGAFMIALVISVALVVTVKTTSWTHKECYEFNNATICVSPEDTIIKKPQYYIIRKKGNR